MKPWELSPEVIHVWRVRLDPPVNSSQEMEQLLSDQEKERARRYHFERDRRRFLVARAALRTILGSYSQVEPRRIEFSYGAQGKPFLAAPPTPLLFNLSHSGDYALVAVAHGREVGVDVEFVRVLADADQISERFFSPGEAKALRSLPEPLQQRAFFACWTRKEAYIKACGGGLTIPLDEYEVSVDPREPAALIAVRNDPGATSRWGMVELAPADGYIAALVAQGRDWQCCCHDWPLSTA